MHTNPPRRDWLVPVLCALIVSALVLSAIGRLLR